MTVYVDTSFLVSLYLTDRHSPQARERVLPRPSLWLTSLHLAEWAHASAQHVFHGKMSVVEAEQLHGNLETDRAAGLWMETPMPEAAFEVCAELARRHGPKLGMRTLDSLHVASALELKANQFWTFDERQAKLAKAVGLKIS